LERKEKRRIGKKTRKGKKRLRQRCTKKVVLLFLVLVLLPDAANDTHIAPTPSIIVFLHISFVRLLLVCLHSVVIVVFVISTVYFFLILRIISLIKQMSTKEYDADAEAVSDLEKARCRRNRRPSVQFIDKNLIRRRSSGPEKQRQYSLQQASRLPSIHSNDELESADLDQEQQQQQEQQQRQYCENSS